MQIDELDTPVPVVDLDIARQNIRRLQSYCDTHGLRLRPHVKTHKLPLFAHEQCRAGAIGITVQQVGEAEIMAQTKKQKAFYDWYQGLKKELDPKVKYAAGFAPPTTATSTTSSSSTT